MARSRGKYARRASYVQAGSTLLTGFGIAGSYGSYNHDRYLAKKHGIPFT
jgi:hypothetical protein